MPDSENRVSPLSALGDGLVLTCAMAGFLVSFLSLYGDGVLPLRLASPLDQCAAQAGSFLLLAVVFALVSLLAWSLPRYRGAAVGALAALWGLLLFFNREAAVQGAGLTLRDVTLIFSRRVSWGWVFQYDPHLTTAQEGGAARLFLLLALAALALALGWAVVRARRWWIAALLTLPPLLPGLLADLYPDWPAFMALALCWCAMLLTDLCKWAAPDRRGVLTLAVLPCVAIALCVITLAFPREGYTRPQWALELETGLHNGANRLTDYFSRFDGPFRSTVTYVGSAEEADLTHAGPLRYSGRTVLRVTSDYAGRMYLRGSSLAVYEDGVWKALPEGTYEQYSSPGAPAPVPLYFPAMQDQGGPVYTATVDNVGAVGSCVYVPYFPTLQNAEDTGALPVEDAYFARRQGTRTHTLSFVELPEPPAGDVWTREGSIILITGRNGADFGSYPEFVYDHYLDVPEELRDCLSQFCADYDIYGVDQEGPGDPLLVAQRAATALDWLCTYDQSAEAPPEGEDPVLYFLNESRRGYCMHFASAATLMLREMGIPARYVSGFTAQSLPGQQTDVPDRAAHAWVEVWVQGFGWYPVEVTPAAAFEWYEQGADPGDLPSEPAAVSEEPADTPTPLETPEEPSARPDDPQESANLPGALPGGPGGGGIDLAPLFTALKALAAVAGISALLWLAQYLPKRYRAKKLSSLDRNQAALACYGYLCRMGRWGGRMDGRAVELAQKARFSQHTLTTEELGGLRALADRERERLCVVLDPLPRLAFRYLWGMPARPKKGEKPENSPENTP